MFTEQFGDRDDVGHRSAQSTDRFAEGNRQQSELYELMPHFGRRSSFTTDDGLPLTKIVRPTEVLREALAQHRLLVRKGEVHRSVPTRPLQAACDEIPLYLVGSCVDRGST